jgi:hypothetical protein
MLGSAVRMRKIVLPTGCNDARLAVNMNTPRSLDVTYAA